MLSFIKGITKTLAVVFFSILLSIFILSFSLSQATKPEVIKSIFKQSIESSIPQATDLNKSYQEFLYLCGNRTFIELPLQEGSKENTTINCSDIRNGNPSTLVTVITDSFFNKVYYRDYGCSFLDCFGEKFDPLFILSKSASTLLVNLSYIVLAIFVIILFVSIPLIKLKRASLIFILNGLPSFLFFLPKDISFKAAGLPVLSVFYPFVSSFLYTLSILSIGCLAVGLILLAISKFTYGVKAGPKKRKV